MKFIIGLATYLRMSQVFLDKCTANPTFHHFIFQIFHCHIAMSFLAFVIFFF